MPSRRGHEEAACQFEYSKTRIVLVIATLTTIRNFTLFACIPSHPSKVSSLTLIKLGNIFTNPVKVYLRGTYKALININFVNLFLFYEIFSSQLHKWNIIFILFQAIRTFEPCSLQVLLWQILQDCLQILDIFGGHI